MLNLNYGKLRTMRTSRR